MAGRHLARVALVVLLLLLGGRARAQQFDLALRMAAAPTGPGPAGGAAGRQVETDALGNVYVFGNLASTIQFGSTTLTVKNGGEIYVAKMSPAGVWLWAVQSQGTGNAFGTSVERMAVDESGNVAITGRFFRPTLAFGPFTLRNADPSGSHSDVYVARLDTHGNWLWATQAGGFYNESVKGIGIGRNQTVTVAGVYSRPGASFGNTFLAAAPEAQDLYVAQLSAAGQWNWAVRGGLATGSLGVGDLALDSHDNAYLTGSFSGKLTLGPIILPDINPHSPSVFIAKVGPAGQWLSANRSRGGYGESGEAIALDGQDNVYLAGHFISTNVSFGAHTISNATTTGGREDVFVAKLGPDNEWQWAAQAGGAELDRGIELAVDPNANVYVVGGFYSPTCTFGPFQLQNAERRGFSEDLFVAKLDGQGQWQWAVRAGGTDEDTPFGISASAAGVLYVTGAYSSPAAAFGSTILQASPFFQEGFLARLLSPTVQIQGAELLCPGGNVSLSATTTGSAAAYEWSTGATSAGIIVTQPGTYTVITTFADGQRSSARKVVAAIAAPTARIVGDSVLCPGTAVQLAALAPNATSYRWSTGATTSTISVTASGTYSLTASFGSGCTATSQLRVRAYAVQIAGEPQLCAAQGSTTLTAVAPGATAFRWSTGATTPALTVAQPGAYSVVATFPAGCSLTASQTVVVPEVAIRGDSLLCAGQSVALSAALPAATAYRWSTGATTPAITVTEAGTYTVEATYGAGCTSRAQLRVRALPALPSFSLGADTVVCDGQALTLRGPSLSAAGTTYQWSDGSRGGTLLVQQSGSYSLQLQTHCGQRTASRTVTFAPCITIPNIITPNGDPLNERFVIQGLAASAWSLSLYNRWGQRVYQARAYHNEWGPEAPAGMYYYVLQRASDALTYKGWLQVVK